jgi:hypothetical protein
MAERQFRAALAKLYKVDPESAWSEIQAVCLDGGGVASPGAIVDRARPKSSPLHDAFEWNDKKAGEKYRIIQARSLVHNFRLVFDDGSETPAMVSVRVVDDAGKRRGYMETNGAMGSADLRAQVLKQALAQLLGMEKRYRGLTELSGVFNAIRETAEKYEVDGKAA